MVIHYLPVLVMIGLGLGIGALLMLLGALLGPRKSDPEKLSQYECGFEPFSDTRAQFDVRFYLIAILFIIFDLEVAFLFPWAVIAKQLAWGPILAMVFFLGLLFVGFLYEWKKGALEWE